MKGIIIAIIAVVSIMAVTAGIGAANSIVGLQWYKWFQPQVEDAKRDVYTHTRAYVESRKQDLVKYRLEYMRSKDPVEKEAIKMTIRHQFAEIDANLLGPELGAFYNEVMYSY